MQRRQVVEDPERPALRRDDQILVVDLDVGDRHVRQVQLERLPVRAVVERDEHPELGAGVEQPFAIGILAHDARRPVGRNAVLAVGQPRPGLAVVVGLDRCTADSRRADSDRPRSTPSLCGAATASMYCTRPPGRQVLRRDVRPRLAVVARHVERAVVRAGPDDARLRRRLGDRVQRAVELLARHVARDRLAARALAAGGMRGEIGRLIRSQVTPSSRVRCRYCEP